MIGPSVSPVTAGERRAETCSYELRLRRARWLAWAFCLLVLASGCANRGETKATSSGRKTTAERESAQESPAVSSSGVDPKTTGSEHVAGSATFSASGQAVRLPGVPTRLTHGPEPARASRFVVGSPGEGVMLGWDLDRVLGSLTDTRSKPRPVEPQYRSQELGGFVDSVPWGDQLLVSATNRLALFSLDRATLKVRGYIPFERPLVDGKPAGNLIPDFIAVQGDTAYMSLEANDRVGVMRFDLTSGSVSHRIYDFAGAPPPLCAIRDRLYVGTGDELLELNAADLRILRRLRFTDPIGHFSCSETEILVGMQSAPELRRVNRLTLQTVQTQRWEGGRLAVFVLPVDDRLVAIADEDAGLVAFCGPTSCETRSTSARPVEVVPLAGKIGVIARGSFTLGGDSNTLEVFDRSLEELGRWSLPQEARGASLC